MLSSIESHVQSVWIMISYQAAKKIFKSVQCLSKLTICFLIWILNVCVICILLSQSNSWALMSLFLQFLRNLCWIIQWWWGATSMKRNLDSWGKNWEPIRYWWITGSTLMSFLLNYNNGCSTISIERSQIQRDHILFEAFFIPVVIYMSVEPLLIFNI